MQTLRGSRQALLPMGLVPVEVGYRAPPISRKLLTIFSKGLLNLCQVSLSPPNPPKYCDEAC